MFQGCITVYLSRYFQCFSLLLSSEATLISYHCVVCLSTTFLIYFWNIFQCLKRRKRDLNPRAGCPTYTLSRGASSASWVFLLSLNKLTTNVHRVTHFVTQKLLYTVIYALSNTFLYYFVLLNCSLIKIVSLSINHYNNREVFHF